MVYLGLSCHHQPQAGAVIQGETWLSSLELKTNNPPSYPLHVWIGDHPFICEAVSNPRAYELLSSVSCRPCPASQILPEPNTPFSSCPVPPAASLLPLFSSHKEHRPGIRQTWRPSLALLLPLYMAWAHHPSSEDLAQVLSLWHGG